MSHFLAELARPVLHGEARLRRLAKASALTPSPQSGAQSAVKGRAIKYGTPVVSTEGRRPERRDLLSTISRLSSREGLSAPRGVYPEVFEGRSGRDDGSAMCDSFAIRGVDHENRRGDVLYHGLHAACATGACAGGTRL